MLFNIQRFSTHDGSGIRTILFLKGCPLRCPWCSNPESQSFDYDIFFDKQKCIGCQECVKASKEGEFEGSAEGIVLHRERVANPRVFMDICPTKAVQVIGEEIDYIKILAEIQKDKLFFENSGGGVTFSGGEPFAQPEQLQMLAKAIKGMGIPVAVETCMDIPWENITGSIEYIDEFLIDVKHIDQKKLKEVTGSNFGQLEQNLRKLEELKVPLIIRMPVIPGFNDSAEDIHGVIDFVGSLDNVREFHMIPYHSYGKNKYHQLGMEYSLPAGTMDKGYLKQFVHYAETKGLLTVVGG